MEKRVMILLSIICLIAITTESYAFDFQDKNYGLEAPEPKVIAFDNNTGAVNTSDFWDDLDTPADIDHNLLNNLEWSVAGHTIDTNFQLGIYNITTTGTGTFGDTSNYALLKVFGEDSSAITNILVTDPTKAQATLYTSGGMEGAIPDANGDFDSYDNAFINYYSDGDIYLADGGGNVYIGYELSGGGDLIWGISGTGGTLLGSGGLSTTSTISNHADDSKHTWGAADATDSYIQFGGTNLEYYSSGAHDFGTGDLTTIGSIITTGGDPIKTGKFLTGLAGRTVFAFSGGDFDIRAGDGTSSTQTVMRVDNSGDIDFYDGNITTTGVGTDGQHITTEANDGGDTNIIIRNTAAAGSADETASLIAQTSTSNYPMGKIEFGREDIYGAAGSRDSFIKVYVADVGTDVLVLEIDSNQDSDFKGNIGITKAVDGGDVNLIIKNIATSGSTDETASIIAQTTGSLDPMGKIVFGRIGTYGAPGSINKDSFLDFYTTLDGTDTLAARITENGDVSWGSTTPTALLPRAPFVAGRIFKIRGVGAEDVALVLRRGSNEDVGLDIWADSDGDVYYDMRWNSDVKGHKFRERTGDAFTIINSLTIQGGNLLMKNNNKKLRIGDPLTNLEISSTGTDGLINTTSDLLLMTGGSVGIDTLTPTYPLEVNDFVGTNNISIYTLGNVSATGYFTRTSVFDNSKNPFDYIFDADYYLDNGKINHSRFYGYVGGSEITDYSRPEIEQYIDDECDEIISYENIANEVCEINNGKIFCNFVNVSTPSYDNVNCTKVIRERAIYPYTKLEDSVSLDAEINLLRQAVYELNERIKILEAG